MFFFQLRAGRGASNGMGYPGYVDGLNFWLGEYWGLFTSFFLHVDVLHVAFNIYWLYLFGTIVETYIGWTRYLLFWLVGTAVSSMTQILCTGDSGVGASGFVYALFGFILVGSRAHPYLARILDQRTIALFIIWFFICVGLTWTGAMAIGNGAHLGGFFFGALCAYALLIREEILWKGVAGLLTALVFLPVFHAPWLNTWNLAQAEKSYDQKKYERTLAYLDHVNLPEFDEYILELRTYSLSQLGRFNEAATTFKNLITQYPAAELPDPAYIYNEYAWLLATSPDDKIRNSSEAIYYARLACEKDGYKNSASLDTLAAAYASADQFDQAISWEQKALGTHPDARDTGELQAHLKLFQQKKPYREAPASSNNGAGT